MTRRTTYRIKQKKQPQQPNQQSTGQIWWSGWRSGFGGGFFTCMVLAAIGFIGYRSCTIAQADGSNTVVCKVDFITGINSKAREKYRNSRSPASQHSGQLESLAREITVKVRSGKSSGSGIIISKQGSWYTVLTNGHVIGEGDEHTIETNDGKAHKAELLQRFDRDKSGEEIESGDDLALFQFSSTHDYKVVTLNLSDLQDGEQVFAAGFPYLTPFVFRNGDITLVLEKPLKMGYQVAYGINIDKGMSGGPLLNGQGELVGVNGKHQPLWDAPYYYKDGAEVKIPREQLNKYSWAIAIATFIEQAPPIVLNGMDIKPALMEPNEAAAKDLKAKLSYQKKGDEFTDIKLKLQGENNQILMDDSLPIDAGEQIRDLGLQVLDLDGDGRSEVIVDLIAEQNISYAYSLIYSYSADGKVGKPLIHDWGSVDKRPRYKLKKDSTGILLLSWNRNFAGVFNQKDAVYPVQIWRYSQGKMLDVSRESKYKALVYKHTVKLWQDYQMRRKRGEEVKGVLAAYLAEKHLLGQAKQGWNVVEVYYEEPDREDYFLQLDNLLKGMGYIRDGGS
ncbi:MAG: serine protease [Hormoscilla sp.]